MKKTTWRKVPICLLGYDIRRWEEPGGKAQYLDFLERRLIVRNTTIGKGMPIEVHEAGPTHIQYKSPWGFLITWPFCFHFWINFKPQDTRVDENGVTLTIPGTEKVLLVSIGWARWDAKDSCYMIPRCYVGLHWD